MRSVSTTRSSARLTSESSAWAIALILSGLAIWKPVQFQELAALMGGYEGARIVAFCGDGAGGDYS